MSKGPRYTRVAAAADLPAGGSLAVKVDGWHVLLADVDGQIHAVNDRCTHAASLLSTGRIRRGMVMCPLHGARFDLATGASLGAGYKPLRCFAVRVINGQIEIAVPDHAPAMEETPVIIG